MKIYRLVSILSILYIMQSAIADTIKNDTQNREPIYVDMPHFPHDPTTEQQEIFNNPPINAVCNIDDIKYAITEDDANFISSCLKSGMDINALIVDKDWRGNIRVTTLLHLALGFQKEKIVELLLKNGADATIDTLYLFNGNKIQACSPLVDSIYFNGKSASVIRYMLINSVSSVPQYHGKIPMIDILVPIIVDPKEMDLWFTKGVNPNLGKRCALEWIQQSGSPALLNVFKKHGAKSCKRI